MQRHHVVERRHGGKDSPKNLLRVTEVEHASIHFSRFLTAQNRVDVLAEYDAALGQLMALPKSRREEFYRQVEEKTGVKIRFY